MKEKNYKQKRKDLKEKKRQTLKDGGFEHAEERKKFVEDVKRTFRSLKRSEKQIIKKQIDEENDNT